MTETSARLYAAGNSGARDSILASIRKNLDASKPFDEDHHRYHSPSNAVQDSPVVDILPSFSDGVIERFCKNLGTVGGHFTVVKNETDASSVVGAIISGLEAKRVAISGSDLVGRVIETNFDAEFVVNASAEWLFDSDVGITSAQCAIAETGTLVLESRAESHRLTSLVPPVHICLVKAENIRQTLGEILELTNRDLSRVITFITGASRTSDIELTLAIGVHGPGELHVIVIADQ